MMVENNISVYGIGFIVIIEAVEGVIIGVFVVDCIMIVCAVIVDGVKLLDLNCFGYVFLFCVQVGGVLMCGGYIEVIIDLMMLVGFKLVGVLCELINDDGMMVCVLECIEFVNKYNMVFVIIEDLVVYCQVYECKVS